MQPVRPSAGRNIIRNAFFSCAMLWKFPFGLAVFFFALTLSDVGCHSEHRSVYDEFYAKLDGIRENKRGELLRTMEFVRGQAASIARDSEMGRLFADKWRIYSRTKDKSASPADLDTLHDLRDRIENRYIERYLTFYDILFIEASGDIFYTVRRQSDYHKNVFRGALARTALSAKLKDDPTRSFVDFENYEISGEPSAFFIEPYRSDPGLSGWFVMQFSINKINDMFSVEDALGRTGEVFLVNEQCTLLTDSRFFVESTVLKKHLSKENIRAKFREGKGHKPVTDYRGYRAITSFEVVSILNSRWLLIAKIDEDEVLTEAYRRKSPEQRDRLLLRAEAAGSVDCRDGKPPVREVEVGMNGFERASDGQVLYTHGISTCTAMVVSKPKDFAYMAHISADDRIYGGERTDLLRRMLRRMEKFDVVENDRRELRVTLVSPRLSISENLVDELVSWGLFLSQIRFVHEPRARYANLSHDYRADETLVEWRLSDGGQRLCTLSESDGNLGALLKRELGGRTAI